MNVVVVHSDAAGDIQRLIQAWIAEKKQVAGDVGLGLSAGNADD